VNCWSVVALALQMQGFNQIRLYKFQINCLRLPMLDYSQKYSKKMQYACDYTSSGKPEPGLPRIFSLFTTVKGIICGEFGVLL